MRSKTGCFSYHYHASYFNGPGPQRLEAKEGVREIEGAISTLSFMRSLRHFQQSGDIMMEDLGIEAKEADVREVAKLLPLPELFSSIASIKADYVLRYQDEQAQAGIDAFSLSQKTINQLREIFLSIDKLCQECQTLIDNHDHIKLLSNARNNLNTLKGMMSISVEAAEARESLNDDKELIHTFELIALDGKRRFALAAASSHKEEVGRLRNVLKMWIEHGKQSKRLYGVILPTSLNLLKKALNCWCAKGG
ncbi:hypothetical protein AMTRI_Chr06g199460 [Amborella trichopoda]